VDIIMAYENMDGALINAAVAAGARGLIVAGVGNGNMTKAALDALAGTGEEGHRLRRAVARADRPGRAQRGSQ
jgi:L-asparaginase